MFVCRLTRAACVTLVSVGAAVWLVPRALRSRLSALRQGSYIDRVQLAFRAFDINGDGRCDGAVSASAWMCSS